MKQLPDITYKQFKCDFCTRVYKTELGARNHEDKCYKNPNRNCPTCNNTGIHQVVDRVDDNGGIRFHDEVCHSCETAKELGGKHYLEETGRI